MAMGLAMKKKVRVNDVVKVDIAIEITWMRICSSAPTTNDVGGFN